MKPNQIYGVDFSGGKDAGRKIWIAGGVVAGNGLRVDLCQQAAMLPNSGAQRERALTALCAFILQQRPCVVGLDFPFGLPRTLVTEDRWEDFARAFGNRYLDADAFKKACWQAAGNKELRRITDQDANTPFSPYNLRLYRQTYYGIRSVLAPLVDSGEVSVLPMQLAVPGRVWLMEICPASTLKEMGLYQTYKDAKSADVRDDILSELKQRLNLVVPDHVRSKIRHDKDGDALDSVIAAAATFRALNGSISYADRGTPAAVEGFVYV